ncbi:hypothetical protein KI387_017624, partial [Taxus chinensis]
VREGRKPAGSAETGNFSTRTSGTNGHADVDSRRSRKPIRSRHVSPTEKGRGSPFRVDRRILSREALGHPGQKDAGGRENTAGP